MVFRRFYALMALTLLVVSSSGCCCWHRCCLFRRPWCGSCESCAPVSCGCECGYMPAAPVVAPPPLAQTPIKGPPIIDGH